MADPLSIDSESFDALRTVFTVPEAVEPSLRAAWVLACGCSTLVQQAWNSRPRT